MSNSTINLDINNISSDRNWVKQAFFIPGSVNLDEGAVVAAKLTARSNEKKGRTYSSAEIKYTDTTPGGNFAINPRPQFTRWADPKLPGLASSSKGMGEYYSEAIDDNAQRIHMSFGVPAYNSMTNFFTRFYDHEIGHLVNSGDSTPFAFTAGRAAGFLLTLPFQLIMGASNVVSRLVSFAGGNPYSKFCYLKPTMPLYWTAVSVLVNRIAVNMGLVEGPDPSGLDGTDITDTDPSKKMNYSDGLDDDEVRVLNRMLPDFMRSDGGIDIYSIASRAQKLANQHQQRLKAIAESGGDYANYSEKITAYLNSKLDPPRAESYNKTYSLPTYLDTFYKESLIGKGDSGLSKQETPMKANTATDAKAAREAAAVYAKNRIEVAKPWDDPKTNGDYFQRELNDGSAFVTFNVDYEGSTSESFSNSTRSSDVESMVNSASSKARSFKFNFAGGNLGDNPLFNALESIGTAIGDFVEGGLVSVGLSGLAAMGGSAFVDMPDFWEDSTADLPKNSYTIKLATPYGNKLSILTNIYIPLCMLLAGALPRSTGKNSYASPFLCNLHSEGRNIIRMGIIDSISIERGTGGIGWSADGLPTSVDVSFSVINLNKIMHIPITDIAGPLDLLSLSMFDEDTVASDYMAALGGLRLYDQFYFVPKMRLAWRNQMADISTWMSPSSWANYFAGTEAGNVLKSVYRGTARFD
jgi:hypothetical protein